MFRSKRIVSAHDRKRLLESIDRALDGWGTYASNLDRFRRDVRSASAVATEEVPENVVTMNSRVVLRNLHTSDAVCYALVYPERESIEDGRISILSPMGMALHGARVGDTITWMSSSGPELATVERLLHQPESTIRLSV